MGHISFWLMLMFLKGDNTATVNKNTETLIRASRDVGLEINVEKLSICCYLNFKRSGLN
jgi:hypothetical protein